MNLEQLDRPSLLARARRQRRVLSVTALISGAIFVVLIIGVVNALSDGSVHVPLTIMALIAGGTAVPAGATALRLGRALDDERSANRHA